jgi:anti-sigma B factor antagonist
MNLTCCIEDRVATVTVFGDVDLASTPELRDALQTALARDDIDAVVADVGGVAFLDSSALGVLVAARKAAELGGRTFTVTRPGPMVTMVLRVTGLYDILVAGAAGGRLTPA